MNKLSRVPQRHETPGSRASADINELQNVLFIMVRTRCRAMRWFININVSARTGVWDNEWLSTNLPNYLVTARQHFSITSRGISFRRRKKDSLGLSPTSVGRISPLFCVARGEILGTIMRKVEAKSTWNPFPSVIRNFSIHERRRWEAVIICSSFTFRRKKVSDEWIMLKRRSELGQLGPLSAPQRYSNQQLKVAANCLLKLSKSTT